jgi:hypothetical protein
LCPLSLPVPSHFHHLLHGKGLGPIGYSIGGGRHLGGEEGDDKERGRTGRRDGREKGNGEEEEASLDVEIETTER